MRYMTTKPALKNILKAMLDRALRREEISLGD
jgi:Holliday junction resolvase RusA-like endonuclease